MQREHEDNPIIFGVTADPFTPAHLEMVRPYISARRKVYIILTVVTYHRPNYKPMLSDVERLEVIEDMLSSLGDEYRTYLAYMGQGTQSQRPDPKGLGLKRKRKARAD